VGLFGASLLTYAGSWLIEVRRPDGLVVDRLNCGHAPVSGVCPRLATWES